MIWFLLGCRDEAPASTENKETPIISEDLECDIDGDCGIGSICEDNECFFGDRNNSAEEAQVLLWEDSEYETLSTSGDVDYFVFSSTGSEYIRIITATDYSDGDTVITLRDPSGRVVASADNFPTGSRVSSLDSVLYAYLQEEGNYIVSVEDINTYYNTDDQFGSPLYEYSISVEEWSRVVLESDSIDQPTVSIDLNQNNSWNSVGVLIDESEDPDSDFIEIDFNSDGTHLHISGMIDIGNSDLRSQIRLLNTDGTTIAEKIDVGPEGSIIFPNISQGTYLIEISDAFGGGGSNHWGFFFIKTTDDPIYPQEEESNDLPEQASVLEYTETTTSSDNLYSYSQTFGSLTTNEDVDWYLGNNPYGEDEDVSMVLCLNAGLYGSNAQPYIEIYDSNFSLLSSGQADENDNPSSALEGITLGQGDFYIRIASFSSDETTQDELDSEDSESSESPEIIEFQSHWYEFITYVATFEPSSYSCP
ncbi:MAG: hypothetical protein CMK59_01305 [Proteobacteria bacterium]|nr:hypothetical protein [Pseudomonadota bacterium]